VSLGVAVAKSDAVAIPVGVQHVEPEISCRAAALLARLSQDVTACDQLRSVRCLLCVFPSRVAGVGD
jgi:hypothetical protein